MWPTDMHILLNEALFYSCGMGHINFTDLQVRFIYQANNMYTQAGSYGGGKGGSSPPPKFFRNSRI